jgi:hypothetical protein
MTSLPMHRFSARLGIAILAVLVLTTTLAVAAAAQGGDRGKVEIEGGATLLTVDSGTLEALTGAGISVEPLGAAQVSQSAGGDVTFAFPITEGWLKASGPSARIEHRGGLSFSDGKTTVSVRAFVINTREGILTARVVGAGVRIPLLQLDLTNVQAFVFEDSAILRGVEASLTSTAANALNNAFGTDLFAEGLTVGTAEVFAVLDD